MNACFSSFMYFIVKILLFLNIDKNYILSFLQLKLEGVNVNEEETVSEPELLAEVIYKSFLFLFCISFLA